MNDQEAPSTRHWIANDERYRPSESTVESIRKGQFLSYMLTSSHLEHESPLYLLLKAFKLIRTLEQLELLTEILKAANVAPEVLIPIIRSLQPPFSQWNDLALPRGKSTRTCLCVWSQLNMTRPYHSPITGRILPTNSTTTTSAPSTVNGGR